MKLACLTGSDCVIMAHAEMHHGRGCGLKTRLLKVEITFL